MGHAVAGFSIRQWRIRYSTHVEERSKEVYTEGRYSGCNECTDRTADERFQCCCPAQAFQVVRDILYDESVSDSSPIGEITTYLERLHGQVERTDQEIDGQYRIHPQRESVCHPFSFWTVTECEDELQSQERKVYPFQNQIDPVCL